MLSLLFIGGASSCAKLLQCQQVDGGKFAVLGCPRVSEVGWHGRRGLSQTHFEAASLCTTMPSVLCYLTRAAQRREAKLAWRGTQRFLQTKSTKLTETRKLSRTDAHGGRFSAQGQELLILSLGLAPECHSLRLMPLDLDARSLTPSLFQPSSCT